jgi:hypothetical protein
MALRAAARPKRLSAATRKTIGLLDNGYAELAIHQEASARRNGMPKSDSQPAE